MAEAVISIVVETLGNLLIEEGKFLHGVRDQVVQLREELKRMLSFLKDADKRQNESDMLRERVSQTRDLAYEAEDLLERYAFKVDSRRGRGVTSIIKRCVCLLDECFTRHQVGSEIESLKAKISQLNESFRNYGIIEIMEREGSSSSRQQQFRRTYSHVVEEDIVGGVTSQVEKLAEKLIGENYRLVSIWGMGGLGKTTLARKVYKHSNVRRHFEAFSWICVTQQWQKKDLLQGIITKFMPEKRDQIEKWRDEELVRELFEFQKNYKCLVVLDDMWNTDAWEGIKNAFSIRERGTKVLLTTRNREVATHITAKGFLYRPQFLNKEESWELLKRKSSIQSSTQVVGFEEIHKMEELGKEMVEHCGGLPLGVLVLGGILATKHSLMDWEIVHKNIKSYLGKGNKIENDQGRLHSILALSYNDLPYQLKPCFLYLSKYLEDADIETESLCQVWMAEGMISADDRIGEETMMDVAERYLEELAERCMVIVEMEEDMPSIPRFKSCRLHDLMREMCVHKAKEENFLELVDYNVAEELVESSSVSSRSTPRLAIHMGGRDVRRYVTPRKEVTQRLRSFSFSIDGKYDGRMKFKCDEFRMLRVLSIEGLVLDISDERSCGETCLLLLDNISFPRAIGKLIHLRYLSLRDSDFTIIPSSISKLKHLQTLDLRCEGLIRIPNAIRKLERLKHLYLPDEEPVLCKFSLNGLHNLEILENFHSGNCGIEVLSTLTKLRHLTATVRNKLEDLEEFINQVNNLIYLRFLSLEIINCDFCSEKGSTVLRKLFSSSRNHLVIIHGKISKLPEYEPCFLSNLHTLSLLSTQMEEDPMRTLEKLPNLRTLYLGNSSYMGEEMICHATGFPQLKSLEVHYLQNLSNWWIEEGAMPNLSRLVIGDSEKLKMIPDGLRFVTTLNELRILNMPEEFNSRLQVKDGREGKDFDKVRHVPSIIF